MFNLFRNFRRTKVWLAVYTIERGNDYIPADARNLANLAAGQIK